MKKRNSGTIVIPHLRWAVEYWEILEENTL